MIDEFTRRRLDNGEYDHYLLLEISGVRIGDTGMVRWRMEQEGDEEYDEQYIADVLEKIIEVIRTNMANTKDIPDD